MMLSGCRPRADPDLRATGNSVQTEIEGARLRARQPDAHWKRTEDRSNSYTSTKQNRYDTRFQGPSFPRGLQAERSTIAAPLRTLRNEGYVEAGRLDTLRSWSEGRISQRRRSHSAERVACAALQNGSPSSGIARSGTASTWSRQTKLTAVFRAASV